MSEDIRIEHLASHARAGETMLLRAFSRHPRVHVPLHVEQKDDPDSLRFATEVQSLEMQNLHPGHWFARAKGLKAGQVILLKQGTWEPRKPFSGVVLVRNPTSFVQSMLEYNRREGLRWALRDKTRYAKTMERLVRWASAMSKGLVRELEAARTTVDALCAFYVYRVSWLASRGLPLIRYEDLVLQPESQLRRACEALKLDWSPALLQSHTAFQGREGHGMNDLTRPVDTGSLAKWNSLPRSVRGRIAALTGRTAAEVGYAVTDDVVDVQA